jgi:hypothetical protein
MIGAKHPGVSMREKLDSDRSMKPARHFTRHRFFLLFIFLLGYLICYPYAQTSTAGYVAFRLLAVAITFLSVYAVSFRRSLVLIALALAIPALVEHLQILNRDASALSIVNICLTLAFDAFIIVIIFRRVFAKVTANSETIFGALCIYQLVGFGFAAVYDLIARLQPHAFYLDPVTNLHTIPTRFDFIYYSFGTMTSLGAAGITAVSDQARSLSVIEAILGLLYLAVLIARLMGAYRGGDTCD